MSKIVGEGERAYLVAGGHGSSLAAQAPVVTRGGQGHVAPEEMRASLRAAIGAEGEAAIVKRLGIGRQTLARIVAGLGVRPGTIAQVREALAS